MFLSEKKENSICRVFQTETQRVIENSCHIHESDWLVGIWSAVEWNAES